MSNTQNRKRLITIVAMFFLPLLVATIWYTQLPDGYKPASSTNNGVLVEPMYRLVAFEQKTLSSETLKGSDLETVWTLVHLIDNACDEACSQSLYDTRQIRLALGKEIDRVKRIAILSATAQTKESAVVNEQMWSSHPDMTFALSAPNGLGAQIKAQGQGQNKNDTYLVDPLGNIMMRFPVELEPKRIMKDLRKLLKLSRIG